MRTLESLESIAKELLETLSSYELDHDEAFYIVGYMERVLLMDLLEQTLEDYGLIEMTDFDEEELERIEMEDEAEELDEEEDKKEDKGEDKGERGEDSK